MTSFIYFYGTFHQNISWSGVCLEDEFPVCWNYWLGWMCHLEKILRYRFGERILRRGRIMLLRVAMFFSMSWTEIALGVVSYSIKNTNTSKGEN